MEPSGAPWRALEAPEGATPPTAPAARGAPWLAIAAVAVAVVVAGAALLFASRSDPTVDVDGALVGATDDLGESPGPSEAVALLVVEVGGAVAEPGVYRLPAGSRVGDAVVAAGGFGPRVDAALADRQLNLAAPLRDGDEVHVPVRGEAAGSGAPDGGPGEGAGAGPIDLNRATRSTGHPAGDRPGHGRQDRRRARGAAVRVDR